MPGTSAMQGSTDIMLQKTDKPVPNSARVNLPHSVREFVERRPMATLYQAPGRINLIGEHTDYNEGYVLPGAAHLHLTFAVEPSFAQDLRVRAGRYDEHVMVELEDPGIRMDHWSRYVAAVVHTANAHGLPLQGLEMVFDGDLPAGAGMSSSSALTCGLIYIMNHQFGWGQSTEQLIRLAQESEHRTGVRGGIMDQFAIFSSRPNEAILLDCRTMTTQPVPIPAEGPSWFVLDSGVHHNLVDSPYNQRREACERIVDLVRQNKPGITALRDVTEHDLMDIASLAARDDLAKARYVIEENARVLAMVAALTDRDWPEVGRLLSQSHHGLRHDYQVSCEELDFLVDSLAGMAGVYGARLMGAGFGGNVLCLAEQDCLDVIKRQLERAYQAQFGLTLKMYRITLDDGIHIIDNQ